MQGDIRDPASLRAACRDIEVVFQTAAAVWDRRTPARVYEQVNIDGKAARELGYWPIVSREEAFRRTVAWLRRQETIKEVERSGLAAPGR